MEWSRQVGMGLDHWIQLSKKEPQYHLILEQLMELRQDIEDELTVMVAGEFNAGKSTFINALLGEKVLSSDVTPETAMVTKLKYGEKRRIIAHYLNGHSQEYDDAWLEQLTAERDGDFKTLRRQLSHVELQLPIELLQSFTIIDTPGLNANNEFHTQATERFLGRTDQAIFLFHALNIGTATEMKWLRKFNEHDIYPFGVINRIDEIDEEEDDLEGLIDFNLPRIGQAVQKLIGVSAKDALDGKLQNNPQLLQWSNWSEVEQLLKSFKDEVNKKLERTYIRLKEPIRQLDEITVERKLSLPVRKLRTKKVENFVSSEFPELILTKERLGEQRNITRYAHEEWNRLLSTTVYTLDGLEGFLRSFSEHYQKLADQSLSDVEPLMIWEEMAAHQFQLFSKKRDDYHTKVKVLSEEREILHQSWQAIRFTNMMGKKNKIEKHARKLEFYHSNRKRLIETRKELVQDFKELEKQLAFIQESVKTIVEEDLHFHVNNEQKEMDSWNRQLETVQKSFSEFSWGDMDQIERLSLWLHDFQVSVGVPLLLPGRDYESFLAYEEVKYLLSNLVHLGNDLPPIEFYPHWKTMNGFSKETETKYELSFPKLTPPELETHELLAAPGELQHNIEAELGEVHAKRIQWLKRGAAAVFLSLSVMGIAHAVSEDSSDQEEVSSDYDESDYYVEEEMDEEQILEDEKRALEARFPKADVEEFLMTLHQRLSNERYSYQDLFSSYGWDSFSPYFDQFAEAELVSFDVTSVEYLSGTDIKAKVIETYKQSGVLKEIHSYYSLTTDSYNRDTLIVNDFSYNLVSETETEIALDGTEIPNFLGEFRDAYMMALNQEDSRYISSFVEQNSAAYQEIFAYINSITGKGYSFEEDGFRVERVSKANTLNEYNVATFEKFIFTDEKDEKTSNERTKNYVVKVLPNNEIVIKDIKIINTKTEAIKVSTVQFVTGQDLNEFIYDYYSAFVNAFNGNGFSYVEDYYDPDGSGYASTQTYINNANSKNMSMNNLELSVESVNRADENHYLVTVYLEDEYSYQDGSGDQKRLRAQYKVKVTKNGDMKIAEDPTIEIIEETDY